MDDEPQLLDGVELNVWKQNNTHVDSDASLLHVRDFHDNFAV